MRLTALLVLLAACPSEPEDTLVQVTASEPQWMVPADNLPVTPQPANNNLSVLQDGDDLYLAWRTGPTHFADESVEMHVVRSDDDGTTWRHELTVALGTDVREPQLVRFPEGVRLYYAQLGTNSLDFEPQGTWTRLRTAPGQWSEPEEVFDDTFIPWRMRAEDGEVRVIGYVGGAGVYDPGSDPLRIHWLKSSDGLDWQPVVPGQPVVLEGGGSESDYAYTDDGALIAVVRNEAGDEDGFGSKICRAEPDALGDWTCNTDRKKYDSPLVFAEAGRIWLVGRRNRTSDGYYDLGEDGELSTLFYRYQIAYWNEPKRCSLWEVDPEGLTVEFVLDLPSRGDTCFPDRIARGDGVHEIWNYTSPVDGPDYDWQAGQTRPTEIYRLDLSFVQVEAP